MSERSTSAGDGAGRESGSGRVVVTGGSGFIGANLVRKLLSLGYEVTVVDDLSTGREDYLSDLDVQWVRRRFQERDVLDSALHDVLAVVHLAAQTGVPGSIEDPLTDFRQNAEGTLQLLEAARRIPHPPRIIFASSNAPLGRQIAPASEDKAPLPVSPYGASKLAAEGYCLAYHGSWALPTVILRFGNVYGPFSAHKSSVVARFFRDIIESGRITIEGDGYQTRDFVYVMDLVSAIVRAIQSSEGLGEVFQIATGVETSIRQLADRVTGLAGEAVEIGHGPARQGDVRKNVSVIDKAGRFLNWRPEHDLDSGLRDTWNWFREHVHKT